MRVGQHGYPSYVLCMASHPRYCALGLVLSLLFCAGLIACLLNRILLNDVFCPTLQVRFTKRCNSDMATILKMRGFIWLPFMFGFYIVA